MLSCSFETIVRQTEPLFRGKWDFWGYQIHIFREASLKPSFQRYIVVVYGARSDHCFLWLPRLPLWFKWENLEKTRMVFWRTYYQLHGYLETYCEKKIQFELLISEIWPKRRKPEVCTLCIRFLSDFHEINKI